MPIYEVIASIEDEILRVSKLDPDEDDICPIDFDLLVIPVKVHKNDEVTLYISRFQGELNNLVVATYGKNQMWDKSMAAKVSEIRIKPDNGKMVLRISGHNDMLDENYLTIMRFEKAPEVGTRIIRERG